MIVRDGKKAISAFALLVFWIWSQDFLLQYLRVVFSKIPYIGVYRDIVFDALFILLIVLSIPKFKVRAWDMFVILAIVVDFYGKLDLLPRCAILYKQVYGRFSVEDSAALYRRHQSG